MSVGFKSKRLDGVIAQAGYDLFPPGVARPTAVGEILITRVLS
jgi:hypothetical protein